MSKKSVWRVPFDKKHAERAQTLLKSPSQCFYDIHWSLPSQVSWKKSLFLICKILDWLLTPDHRYSIISRDNVTIPIQIQLSRKQKKFSQFFAAFLKSRLNFKYFGEKDDAHIFCTSDMTCKTLRLFVKTLSASEKYLVLNRDNLKIPIQAQLSRKEKNFSQFLAPFLKSSLNFKSFF